MTKYIVSSRDGDVARLSKEDVIQDAIGLLEFYPYSETDTNKAAKRYVGIMNTFNMAARASDVSETEVLMPELLDRMLCAALLLTKVDQLEIKRRQGRKLKRVHRKSARS